MQTEVAVISTEHDAGKACALAAVATQKRVTLRLNLRSMSTALLIVIDAV
jgi:hypothetical protein